MLEIIAPIFYQQHDEPKNPNKFSVWNNLNNSEIYVYDGKKWREMLAYKGEKNTEKTKKYEVSEEEYEFLTAFKKMFKKGED